MAAAERLYRAAWETDPQGGEAQHLLGLLAHGRGDSGGAAVLIGGAIAVHGDRPTYHFNLGIVLAALGDAAGAIAAYRRAAELRPADAKVWNNLGVALGREGALDEACAALRRAVACAPRSVEALVNLCAALARLGQPGEADEAIGAGRSAVGLAPDFAPAHGALASALAAGGRLGAAVEAAERAAALAPLDGRSALTLARLLFRARRWAEAAEAAERAVRLGAEDGDGLLGAATLRQGDALASLAFLDRALDGGWGEDSALAAASRGLALLALGRRDEAAAWLGLEGLLGERMLAPEGWSGPSAFNSALEAEVLAHPTLRREPQGYVSRGGWLTGNLLLAPTPLLRTLEMALRRAIDAWTSELSPASHPFVRSRPSRYRLVAWASILEAGASLASHIHEGAWASGAYYARAPRFDPARNAGDEKAGWIEFGLRPDGSRFAFEPLTASRRPREGLLLLFPAHLHHRTLEFGDPGKRITISFNCYAI